MDDRTFPRPAAFDPLRGARRLAGAIGLAALLWAVPAARAERPASAARAGLDLAQAAALAWAPDAALTYVENDEDLDGDGRAARWGYLFRSPALGKSRAYSVRDGRIVVAEDLDMKFDAPALASDWIDSGRAREAADRGPARRFLERQRGRLATMLLMRGPFQDGDPDETTWTLIYTAPGAPSLFVVVDAAGGRVRRTWRG